MHAFMHLYFPFVNQMAAGTFAQTPWSAIAALLSKQLTGDLPESGLKLILTSSQSELDLKAFPSSDTCESIKPVHLYGYIE